MNIFTQTAKEEAYEIDTNRHSLPALIGFGGSNTSRRARARCRRDGDPHLGHGDNDRNNCVKSNQAKSSFRFFSHNSCKIRTDML